MDLYKIDIGVTIWQTVCAILLITIFYLIGRYLFKKIKKQ